MIFEWDKANMNNISQTDWERVRKLSDDDIDFSDIPETTDEFWKDAEWVLPHKRDSLIKVLKIVNKKMRGMVQ